ncbi:efflux RND transporter permease subunit [Pseudoalteromonas fenneropenaei]|uniref:Efflux RND transporter permease subunit n=1 Tax=Pseudoalteromonas fenneropenaei TaxID=1737459 RepID=A0ABV7CH91_9GAMM
MAKVIVALLKPRLIFGIALLLSLTGVASWFTIYEQEDPAFPYRNGTITLQSPGSSISVLNNTVVAPLEQVLRQVDEIRTFDVSVVHGALSVGIELQETIYDTDSAWRRVRDRLAGLATTLAPLQLQLMDRIQDTEGILLSVHSGKGLVLDRQLALSVRDELYKIPGVRKVSLVGDPGQRIEVIYPQMQMLQSGVSPLELASAIRQANSNEISGEILFDAIRTTVQPLTHLTGIAAIESLHVKVAAQSALPLTSLAEVRSSFDSDKLPRFWLDGQPTIGLAVTVVPNSIRSSNFSQAFKTTIAELNSRFSPSEIKIQLFQPEQTKLRRQDLESSLLLSAVAVVLVLMVLMSLRAALIVGISLLVITCCSIAVFALGGGILQQMTIAGLILSLGLMVDSSIIMVERVSFYRESALSLRYAIANSIRDLYKPLLSSTLTTIAAFIPMLLAKGDVADFISSIPVVVIITITMSFITAIVLIPLMCCYLIGQPSTMQSAKWVWLESKIRGAFAHRGLIVVFVIIGLAAFLQFKAVSTQFFPSSGRAQAYVDVELAFGSSIEATQAVVDKLNKHIHADLRVDKLMTFVGSSGPRFYYNLAQKPEQSHFARIVFTTKNSNDVSNLVRQFNAELPLLFPAVIIQANELGQGPPIASPIEINVMATHDQDAFQAAEAILSKLHLNPAIEKIRRDYDLGKPQLQLQLEQQQLQLVGLNETVVSQYLAWRTSGLLVTTIVDNGELIPVYLRDSAEGVPSWQLSSTLLKGAQSQLLPLDLIADINVVGVPPVLKRTTGFTRFTILADVVAGKDEEEVIAALIEPIAALAQKYQARVEFGGEFEEAAEANQALVKALPIGVMIVFVVLMLQFNSMRLVLLVFVSIPLAMIGAPVALALTNTPFGFMSILGLLTLMGIVVNTAILLIDGAVGKIKAGEAVKLAVDEALKERMRAVLLTTLTTVVGMLPLALGNSALWPPLAWTVIGGLLSATLLIPLVLPQLLIWLLKPRKLRNRIL